LTKAGWDVAQIREEFQITKGRINVRGKLVARKQASRADYVLFHKPNIPLAIIEAKDKSHSIGSGMQQALRYAEMLDVPFAFSSNGNGFLFHDRTVKSGTVERELKLNEFPSPASLWERLCEFRSLATKQQTIVTQDYYSDASGKEPRYYQLNAINKVVEAVAKGQERILLVMATGTGKTFCAFQFIWRLWKAKTKKRILFLADRNILVDQTKTNDFKPFGNAMTKIKNRQVDKSYEIYLSLYQAVTGTEEEKNIYKQFSPDFFDLIVVDECHRGSAAADSAWREILEYFSSATQVGMTATPRETATISNIDYFGEPVYTYSLKQGIQDGFLAPYKVVRIDLDRDLLGWRPERGQIDEQGFEIEDRVYNQKDMDRNLVLKKRTAVVAHTITRYLKEANRFDKTIVFCEDIEHAERMREALVNLNADMVALDSRYVTQITGDNEDGKNQLDNFIDPESRYPVIATTSKLLTTGVDCQTCKVIVLDQTINSMTEFKQIIGRGTRVREDFDKYYFTIIDFKKATELFADRDFDGPPVQIYSPKPDDPVCPPEPTKEPVEPPTSDPPDDDGFPGDDGGETIIYDPEPGFPVDEEPERPRKYFVRDVEVSILAERVQYLDPDGKLITESLKDYTKSHVKEEFATLNEFLSHWSSSDRKTAIVEELEEKGVIFEALKDEVGKEYEPFDLICHVVYDQPPLTRKERAKNVVAKGYFRKYKAELREVLEALLDKYADSGLDDLENMETLRVAPLDKFGTPVEIVSRFGSKEKFQRAVRDLSNQLYSQAS